MGRTVTIRDHSRLFTEIIAAEGITKMRSITYLSILSLVGGSTQMPTHTEDYKNQNLRLYNVEDIGPELIYERFPQLSDAYGKKIIVAYYPVDSLQADSNDLNDDPKDGKIPYHDIEKRQIEEQDDAFDDVVSGIEVAEKGELISSANGRKKIRFPPAFHG